MDLAEFLRHETDYFVVPSGEYIFHEGAPADSMYVIIEGTAEIRVGGRVVEVSGSGRLIGEMALIDNGPRTATVRALTQCKLLPIDKQRFHSLVTEDPQFATHVMKVMAGRLRQTDYLVAEDSAVEKPS